MILLTGGGGFLGSALAVALSSRGQRVRCAGRRPQAPMEIGAAEYVRADLQSIGPDSSLFDEVHTIIHLASTTIPSTSMADMEHDALTNIGMALRLLEAVRRRHIKTFIFASSGGTVYGAPARLPVEEHDPTEPISAYGITKLAVEKYVGLYARLHGIRGVSLRVANPYGSGQFAGASVGVVAHLLKSIHNRSPFTVWGNGSVVRDYLHVDDFVRAVQHVLSEPGIDAGVYNLGSGRGHSLVELITIAAKVTGIAPDVRYEAGRPIDVPEIYLSTTKFRTATRWQPTITLEIGMGKLWRHLRSFPSNADRVNSGSPGRSSDE